MTLLLKTELSQPIGKPIKVIVEFSIDGADPSVGLMDDYASIETVLVANTKFYLEELLSEDLLKDLAHECLKHYQQEYKL